MKLISVNVGTPQEHEWNGKTVRTSIFKHPVSERVAVRDNNLQGDRQSDLSVHGGPTKAVYAYPSEHYAFWRNEYPELDFSWGMFGENLTTEGLLETETCVGDRIRIGSTLLVATEPRIPCFKLAMRLGRPDIVKRFLSSQRSGIYFAIEREGELGVGDLLEKLSEDPHRVRIRDIVSAYTTDTSNLDLLRSALAVPALPEKWRVKFAKRIQELESRSA